MATVKFLNAAGKYDDPSARHNVINYICQRTKTPSGLIIGCPMSPAVAAAEMQSVAQNFHKDNKVRIRHFVIALYKGELPSLTHIDAMAEDICRELGQTYQIICALHEDTQIPHIHFVFNPVSYVNGSKYSGTRAEHRGLMDLLWRVVSRHGIRTFYEIKYRPESADQHELD